MNSTALLLRAQLRQLTARHGVVVSPVELPLDGPHDGAMSIAGTASTSAIDLERTKIAPYAFGATVDPAQVRLLLRHDPTRIAGTISALEYADEGRRLML
jgi:hypothetical protein